MSFRNPILAGAVLVRRAIESVNFVTGHTGWMIGNDGTAEFNGATFRGTVVVQGNQAVLFYSGTPAAGNLVLAISPAAGTDVFGNTYSQGLTIGGAGGFEIVLGLTGGSPLMFFPTGNTGIQNSSGLQAILQGTGNAAFDQLQILGAQNKTHTEAVDSSWSSASTDGTQQAQILDFFHDPNGVFHFYRTMGYWGNSITGAITGVQPGTGGSSASPATAETWHQVGATGQPAYGTGFAVNAADQAPRFRLEGLAGGQVRLDGTAFTTAATAANAVIFTLPVGYRPTQRRRFIGVTNASGYTAAGATLVTVNTSGTVVCVPACSAAGQQICLDGITFPVD